MEKIDYLICRYPLHVASDSEISRLPDLFREIGFQPRRITVRKKSVKVLGGLLEFSKSSVIFED